MCGADTPIVTCWLYALGDFLLCILVVVICVDMGADGVARDPKQAMHWLRKAAVLGSNDARRVLTQQAKKARKHAARSEAATAGIPEAEADLDRE